MDLLLTPKKKFFIVVFIVLCLVWLGTGFLRDLTLPLPLDVEAQNSPEPKSETNAGGKERINDNDKKHHKWLKTAMGQELDHLHIFVQVSDLHLSIYHDKNRGPDFKKFCENTIPIIHPEAVIVTGDLTDDKYPDKTGSKQFEEEWKMYHDILTETSVTNKTVWLDIRGNHDAFDVPSIESYKNYYRKYSHQGRNHSKHYRYTHRTQDGDSISFIGFDACPDPGPRRPFNFFGMVTENDLQTLQNYFSQSQNNDMTITFGHYVTSTITGDLPRLRNILGQGSIYMSGHLHTLGGLVTDMYTEHQSGLLELEVGDWMDNRIYRVFAVDHGLFSFTDQKHGSWPVVMVTNPKHGKFVMPGNEPYQNMINSTHIRIVAFSASPITTVRVKIDNKTVGEAVHVGKALYTLQWQPLQYASGVHDMTVTVKDSKGRVKILSQPFSLDATRIPFDLLRRFIVMSRHHLVLKTLFSLAFIVTVLPMLLIKVINVNVEISAGSNRVCGCATWLCQLGLRRYKLLANSGTIYWTLLLFHFYVAIGPWFVGEVMEGYIGAVFVFGVAVNGSFIPGSITYLYGFFQMLIFNLPLTWYLMHILDHQICGHKKPRKNLLARLPSAARWCLHHGLFCMIVLYEIYIAYAGFYRSYGLMSLLLCPTRTWSVGLALVLRYIAMGKRKIGHQPVQSLREVELEEHTS